MQNLSSNPITYRERFRPQYHFSALYGWLNDPNGLIYYRGEYHLFYQYAPKSLFWDEPHWGHAVSPDLLHWQHLPIALYPDKIGVIFSGTVVVDSCNTTGFFPSGEGLVAIFTHHCPNKKECQSLAYSEDSGRSWFKYDENPVLCGSEDIALKDFRDPCVFWNKETNLWLMLLGGGRYRIYSSPDLKVWTLETEWAVDEEFPDLFLLNGQWVLNVNGFGYYVGAFRNYRLIPSQPMMQEDFGSSWQACYHFAGLPEGGQTIIGWMRDSGKGPTFPWRGNLSIPRDVSLIQRDGRYILKQKPIEALKSIRTILYEACNLPLGDVCLKDARGQCLDIELDVALAGDRPLGLCVFKKDDRYTEIGYHPAEHMAYVDTRKAHAPEFDAKSSMFLWALHQNDQQTALLGRRFSTYCPMGETLRLRILIDRSTVEVFMADGEAVCTLSVYPKEDADGVELFGSPVLIVRHVAVHRLASVWNVD